MPSWVLLFAAALAGQTPAGDVAAPGAAGSSGPVEEAPGAEAPTPGDDAAASVDPAPAPSGPAGSERGGEAVDLDAALFSLLDAARDPVRVAVAPIVDEKTSRGERLGAQIARVLVSSTDLEVVTAARIEATLEGAAQGLEAGGELGALRPFAADHVILGEVHEVGGAVELQLRLLHVESGAVLARASASVTGEGQRTSVDARTVRGALDALAQQVAEAMERVPGDLRYQRLAVAPLEAQGEAVLGSRIERFVQAELGRALGRRGFLVVERDRLDEALNQAAIGELLDEADVPAVGRALDAQAIVLGSVSETGETFTVSVRVVEASHGNVVGAGDAQLRRDNAISLSSRAIETRTPIDALFRSAVAPGWGQFYNQEPVKGAVLGIATYGAAATTLGLATASVVAWVLYAGALPDDTKAGSARYDNILLARGVRDGLVIATGAMGLAALSLWGVTASDALLTALYAE